MKILISIGIALSLILLVWIDRPEYGVFMCYRPKEH